MGLVSLSLKLQFSPAYPFRSPEATVFCFFSSSFLNRVPMSKYYADAAIVHQYQAWKYMKTLALLPSVLSCNMFISKFCNNSYSVFLLFWMQMSFIDEPRIMIILSENASCCCCFLGPVSCSCWDIFHLPHILLTVSGWLWGSAGPCGPRVSLGPAPLLATHLSRLIPSGFCPTSISSKIWGPQWPKSHNK